MLNRKILKMKRLSHRLRQAITWARRNKSTYLLGMSEQFDQFTVEEAETLANHLDKHIAAALHGWGYVDQRMKNYGGTF